MSLIRTRPGGDLDSILGYTHEAILLSAIDINNSHTLVYLRSRFSHATHIHRRDPDAQASLLLSIVKDDLKN